MLAHQSQDFIPDIDAESPGNHSDQQQVDYAAARHISNGAQPADNRRIDGLPL
jgi:hypothetical protein